MNTCIFTGRTTADIEVRYSQQSNLAIGTFNLAVDTGYGDKKKTAFLKMTAFGKTAEVMQKYVKKGMKIGVRTHAVQEEWVDKTGAKRRQIAFVVDEVELPPKSEGYSQPVSEPASGTDWENIDEGELPFE